MNNERHMFRTSWVDSHNDEAMEDELYEIPASHTEGDGWQKMRLTEACGAASFRLNAHPMPSCGVGRQDLLKSVATERVHGLSGLWAKHACAC